ncbi:MAG: hypothetical protein F6J90_31360 [Moorea sp. SIOASIH]|nr:hypothetical protein [Moorena sp. SIOASIH]
MAHGSVCGTPRRTAVCPVETTAVAHGAWVCVRNLLPHRCLPRGDPQDRTASPVPKLHPYKGFISKLYGRCTKRV